MFQKVYYANDLLLSDERELRNAFVSAKQSYDTQMKVTQAGLFLAFWPATWKLALHVRPASVALWAGAYYFGLYKGLAQPFAVQQFQSSLNKSALGFAPKYGIKLEDEL